MLITPRLVRLVRVASAVFFLAVALAIRAVGSGSLESDGSLAQYSGTAVYASMVYTGVLFLWPRISPLLAGGTGNVSQGSSGTPAW